MTNLTTGVLTTADGTRISFQTEGAEGAPWIVLSNSLATDRGVWDPQISALTKSRRVLRYDSRGHGDSDPATPPYNFDQLSGDVVDLMDFLEIESAEFMGVSLGGMTGLALAIAHPDRVSKLICCDARSDAPEAYKGIWDGNIARLHDQGIEALSSTTLERWFSAAFLADPANVDTLAEVRSMIHRTSAAGYEGVARCLQSLDLLGDLPRIRCPVLYVTGEFDPAAPVPVMQAMCDVTEGAQFAVVEDAAHLSNIEQPERFTRIIAGFLNLE